MRNSYKTALVISLIIVIFGISGLVLYLTGIMEVIGTSFSSLGSTAETRPTATAPVKTTDKVLYGYDYIGDEQVRILYGQIKEYTYENNESSIIVGSRLSERQMFEAIRAFKDDYPEVFWLESSCTYYYDDEMTYINLDYSMSPDERKAAQEELETELSEIVSSVPENASDYEIEIFINDYLCDNCEYNTAAAEDDEIRGNCGNSYGAIVEHSAVCEGYARAFNLLCSRFGIDCVNVSGSSEGVNHIWNCVKINGDWYQVDVTWNDPDSDNELSEFSFSDYLYFNLTDDKIYQDHIAGELFEEVTDEEYAELDCNANLFVPNCTATDFNYYIYNGSVLYDLNDSGAIVNGISEAAENGEEYYFITVDGSLDFDTVSNSAIEDGYIANWLSAVNLNSLYNINLKPETNVYTADRINLMIIKLDYE